MHFKYVVQFMIIVAFSFVGEVLHWAIPLPIPASIYGIILLFAALELKWIKVDDIKEVSNFLITVMPIMFLPPAVGLMSSWGVVKDSLFQYLIVIVVSTFVVMAVAGWATQLIIRKSNKK